MEYNDKPLVQCPYYKKEKQNTIVCEGVCDGNCLELTFRSSEKKRFYRAQYCNSKYGDCRITKMLHEKWGYDG